MVMLSKAEGAPTIGSVRRAREAAELAAIKSHPAVKAVLDAFPDAKIADVRRMAGIEPEAEHGSEDETKTG